MEQLLHKVMHLHQHKSITAGGFFPVNMALLFKVQLNPA